MTPSQDGALLLSELTDEAVLRSNLFKGAVAGREAVKRVIEAIDALCQEQSLVYRHRVGNREFILTDAITSSGEKIQMTTVGIRDDNGWICAIMMDHSPPTAAAQVAAELEAQTRAA